MDKLSGLVRRRQSARETSQQPSQDVLSPVFPHIRQFEPSLGESVILPRIYLSGKAAAEPSGDPAAHYFMQQVETSSSTATDQQQSLVVGIRFVLTVGSNMKPPIEHLLDCRWSAGSLVLTAPWGTLRIRLIPVVLDMPPTSCDTLRHRPAPTESAADVAQRWSATIELHERKALLDLEKCRASSTSEAEDNKVLLLILPIYFVTVELVDNAAGRLRDALPWTQLALTMFSPAINATAPASPIPTYWLVWDALRNMLAEHMTGEQQVPGVKLPPSPGMLVHCLLGVSRSASAVVAFFMERYRISFVDALAAVRRARPQAQPNPCFAAELLSLQRRLLAPE